MIDMSECSRETAGRHLGNTLEHYRDRNNLLILAISPGGVLIARELMQRLNAAMDIMLVSRLEYPCASEEVELKNLELLYRRNRPQPDLEHKTVILVDDVISTGETMRAAIAYAKSKHAASIVIAVAIASADAAELFCDLVDEVVFLKAYDEFISVEHHCQNFQQVTEQQVCDLLTP